MQAARLSLLAFAGIALSMQVGSATAANPTVYVTYRTDCTFALTLDSGAAVTTIPPGSYQVFVSTPFPFADNPPPTCEFPKFRLTGPGVDLSTDLSGGGDTTSQLSATFAPSSTYVVQDGQQPALSRTTFTTAASGTPVVPTVTSTTSSSGSSAGSKSADVVGSAVGATAVRGVLLGTVKPGGARALTLTRNRKAVTTLKAGRYTVTIDDRSTRSAFVLQEVRKASKTVTGVSFVGRRSVKVTLTAGQWFFYSTFLGKKSYFIVTA
ncbi:MAG TPA: hypothetical protein VH063_14145 [Gaiellaceae bacterium]|jgi:hypothetical protein|nr:hypothetical protein [Gaiellaceae bacterium]